MSDPFTGRPQHAFDTDRLAAYIRAKIENFVGGLRIEQFAIGRSNPTYRVTAGEHSYVLRGKPSGQLLPSAHAVDREYKVLTALAGTDVPVPRTYVLCEDESVIGTAFYLMEYVQGRVLIDPAMPGMSPRQRGAHYEELNRVIAALHRVDPQAVGLGKYGKPDNYVARQIDRWTRQYRASQTQRIEAMDRLIEWLPQHVPAGDEMAIAHGDYRIDNVIFHPEEPRILAVLDWELSTLGHPAADFAYHCMTWRLSPAQFQGLVGQDLFALGIPDENAYVAAYCRRMGRTTIPYWDYYMAFSMFRLAAITQGIMARALQGNSVSTDAPEMGQRARLIAEQALRQLEQ